MVSSKVDWSVEIENAQHQTLINLGNVTWQRVRYGSERTDFGADVHPCRDCGVIKGQIHVEHCCVECCPSCGGQLFSCGKC